MSVGCWCLPIKGFSQDRVRNEETFYTMNSITELYVLKTIANMSCCFGILLLIISDDISASLLLFHILHCIIQADNSFTLLIVIKMQPLAMKGFATRGGDRIT